jgi:glycerol-3-phosphate acyltransferase PlsY
MPGDQHTQLILAFVTGYLLGSIPFGMLLTRLAGKGDVRKVGSGNIGATNVLRAAGRATAALTLLLDALKATAAVLIARQLWPGSEPFAAAGALIGHLYPVWLKFRGGKGVATYLGLLIPLLWPAAAIFAIVWLAALAIVRISSVAGMLAAVSAPIAAAIFGAATLFPILLGFTLLVLWRHHGNLARLKAGKEPKIGEKSG